MSPAEGRGKCRDLLLVGRGEHAAVGAIHHDEPACAGHRRKVLLSHVLRLDGLVGARQKRRVVVRCEPGQTRRRNYDEGGNRDPRHYDTPRMGDDGPAESVEHHSSRRWARRQAVRIVDIRLWR